MTNGYSIEQRSFIDSQRLIGADHELFLIFSQRDFITQVGQASLSGLLLTTLISLRAEGGGRS